MRPSPRTSTALRVLRAIALWLSLASSLLACTAVCAAAPPAPEFLPGQPAAVGDKVVMTWAPVAGALSYAVFRNGQRLTQTGETFFSEPLPTEPGEYRYQLSAFDASGQPSALSRPGLVRVVALAAPKSVLTLPDPATRTLGLVWDSVEGAVLYNVYRSRAGSAPLLIATTRETAYTDKETASDVPHTYTIRARAASGPEGPASSPVTAVLTGGPRRSAKEPEIVFRAAPADEVLLVDKVGQARLTQVSYLGTDPSGSVWIVLPLTRQIHQLDAEGKPALSLGPYVYADSGLALVPQKLAFGPNGNLYVTDALNATLSCIDRAGTLLWSRGVITPPPTMKEIWEGFPEAVTVLPASPSSVLCLADEIWVTDQRFQLLYRFDYDGKFLGVISSYEVPDKKERVRLAAVGEIAAAGEERFILTFPLSHKAIVVDRNLRLLAEIGAKSLGLLGGFVGLHGVQWLPGQGILLTDPSVGTIQLFDAATGQYLWHLSGPRARQDPIYKERAELPAGKPNMAVQDGQGRVWFYSASRKSLVVLKPSGRVVPPLPENRGKQP